MFIAVINEGWALAEEQKHREQLRKFVGRTDLEHVEQRWLAWWNPRVMHDGRADSTAIDISRRGRKFSPASIFVRIYEGGD